MYFRTGTFWHLLCIGLYAQTETVQPRTVLCIDDDRDLLAMSRTYLETAGYRVLTALSGTEGLGVLAGQAVDAVVVDYQMPAMNGEEVARQVREVYPDIPIILFTGDVENIPRSVLEVVDICIAKGAPTKNLVIALAQLMRGQQAGWPKPRSLRRFRVEVPVMLKIDRAGMSETIRGQSVNLSEGGTGASFDRALRVGEVVSLNLHLSPGHVYLKVPAQVRHSSGRVHGFEFLQTTPAQRQLVRLVCETMSS
jgi:two-component system alkaline phosphatase synthesis response regulator PhoP